MLRLWKRLSNCCLGLLIRSILTAAGKMGRWGWLSAYGYGKPRGLGSVRVKIDKCKLLPETDEQKFIEKSREDWPVWIEAALSKLPDKSLRTWLKLLAWDTKEGRCDYPKGEDNKVYTYHTKIRKDHAEARRQKKDNPQPDRRLLKRP
jgi:hypothetical protein